METYDVYEIYYRGKVADYKDMISDGNEGYCRGSFADYVYKNGDCDLVATYDSLKEALKDPFFSEVQSVGINGGEFSLVPNFTAVLEALTSLPRLGTRRWGGPIWCGGCIAPAAPCAMRLRRRC